MHDQLTRAWVDIDLGALRRNGAALAARAGVPLLPMVKADAYGAGAVPVARALESLEPWGFGVATVAEGAALRAAGIARPVIVFTPLLHADLLAAHEWALTPVLCSSAAIRDWIGLGGGPWHLGIDTGMSRVGVRWTEVESVADLARAHPPQGACTHFHSAEKSDGTAAEQERRFAEALARLPARPELLHAENSAAIVRRKRSAYDLVRPGIFLYGVGTGAGAALDPEPVVHLRARIVDERQLAAGDTVSYDATWRANGARRIVTLACGYADGYVRALGNRSEALVHGRRVPVVGIVTMDMVMLDVTGLEVAVGEEATLIGRGGAELLTVEDVAAHAQISPYELLAGLRGRLVKRYLEHVP